MLNELVEYSAEMQSLMKQISKMTCGKKFGKTSILYPMDHVCDRRSDH